MKNTKYTHLKVQERKSEISLKMRKLKPFLYLETMAANLQIRNNIQGNLILEKNHD